MSLKETEQIIVSKYKEHSVYIAVVIGDTFYIIVHCVTHPAGQKGHCSISMFYFIFSEKQLYCVMILGGSNRFNFATQF